MLGYSKEDFDEMIYGVNTAVLLINSDENPAIHRMLSEASGFLQDLQSKGYFD
jgi:hypothetical protein